MEKAIAKLKEQRKFGTRTAKRQGGNLEVGLGIMQGSSGNGIWKQILGLPSCTCMYIYEPEEAPLV